MPLPSTGTLAGIGSAFCLVLVAFRKRKAKRQQRPVGPQDATQSASDALHRTNRRIQAQTAETVGFLFHYCPYPK